MEFRPCIDIHNGAVKQIVGSSLKDEGDTAKENFVSAKEASYYAALYRERGLKGGHVILLNAADSPHYRETLTQAFSALSAYPGGLQIGGGITADNAKDFIDAGASHVIVTSYVFQNGLLRQDRLEALCQAVGKDHIVLDVSCRRFADKETGQDAYYIMTDRWQVKSKTTVDPHLLESLRGYCDEFLIHAVDVEGKRGGVETDLIRLLSSFTDRPVTYAGGVHSFSDLQTIKTAGNDRINVTIGSALSLFGGDMDFDSVCAFFA